MNITLQIMWNPPAHILTTEKESIGRYPKGAVHAVYDTNDLKEPPSKNSRMIFIHLQNVSDLYLKTENLSVSVYDKEEAEKVTYRRQWIYDISTLTEKQIEDIESKREITLSLLDKTAIKKVGTSTVLTDKDIQ